MGISTYDAIVCVDKKKRSPGEGGVENNTIPSILF